MGIAFRKQAGQELRSSAIYEVYKRWCGENGFKFENAANFKKKMAAAGFVYMQRRPWNEKNAGATMMVNDVMLAPPDEFSAEEASPDLVP